MNISLLPPVDARFVHGIDSYSLRLITAVHVYEDGKKQTCIEKTRASAEKLMLKRVNLSLPEPSGKVDRKPPECPLNGNGSTS